MNEFYSRSKRKIIRKDIKIQPIVTDNPDPKEKEYQPQKSTIVDIINISQQLDTNNIEKQNRRNVYLDGTVGGSLNTTYNQLNINIMSLIYLKSWSHFKLNFNSLNSVFMFIVLILLIFDWYF